MGQWSDLLADLLMMIHEHLDLYPDKIRFRCVCTHWQSTSPEELPGLRQPQPPWLLLPYATGSLCGLYHPFENKVYEIDLPEAGEKYFKGSGHGWVVTIQVDGSINVVNPLTRVRVPLRPRYKFPDIIAYRPDKPGEEYYLEKDRYSFNGAGAPYTQSSMHVRNSSIDKVALSCSPTCNDFVAVAIYRTGYLAYYKVGDDKWNDMVEVDTTKYYEYQDVAFCDGKLYAMTTGGELMIYNDIVSYPKLRHYVPVYKGFHPVINLRLVNSFDGIMAIRRDEHCHRRQECKHKFIEDKNASINSEHMVLRFSSLTRGR